MTDPYTRPERIAIRAESGMTEREAIKLTDKELRYNRKPDDREYGKQQISQMWRMLGRGI